MSREMPSVGVYSPLHAVSEHFVERLVGSLDAAGIGHRRLSSRNGEVGRDRLEKACVLGAHVRNVHRHVRGEGPTVVAWPLLGWWEMPLWRSPTHATFVTMHDPEPLVAQNGLTPAAGRRAARIAGSGWPHVVTLSPEARDVVVRYFDPERVHLLPHPLRAPQSVATEGDRRAVLVLGQYKPARDLDVMASIGNELARAGWQPTVAGRGWPSIPGWRVVDRFLLDVEFEALLASAAAVLIPYKFYFQSGVALRALEAGTPVVGRPAGFLSSIFGDSFPGAVERWSDPSCWLAAVQAASEQRDVQLARAKVYAALGDRQWAELLTGSQG